MNKFQFIIGMLVVLLAPVIVTGIQYPATKDIGNFPFIKYWLVLIPCVILIFLCFSIYDRKTK